VAADSIEQRIDDILRRCAAKREIQKRNEPTPRTSISDRLTAILGGERFSLGPTNARVILSDYNLAAAECRFAGKLHALVDVALAKLEKDMETGGGTMDSGESAGVESELMSQWMDKSKSLPQSSQREHRGTTEVSQKADAFNEESFGHPSRKPRSAACSIHA